MKKLLLNIVLTLFIVPVLYSQNISDIKIGVIHSAKTDELLHKDDNQFNPIQNWELFFLNRKIPYKVYSDADLDDNDFTDADVLILPFVEILSPDAKENLIDFVNEGKGLIILGAIGSYDENGMRSKGNFVNNLCGFQLYQLETNGEIAERHTITVNTFLSRSVPLAGDLTILNRPAPLYVRVIKNVKSLGRYILKDNSDTKKSGIVAVSKGKGRIVWFGFSLSQLSAENDIIEKIIFNSIEWLSNKPYLQLAPIVRDNKVPVVISNFINNPSKISDKLLNELSSDNFKSNSFIESSSLSNSDMKINKLAATGDINLKFDFFDINNRGVNKDSLLNNSYQFLNNKSKQKYFGVAVENFYGSISAFNLSPFQFFTIGDKLFLNESGVQKKVIPIINKFSFTFRNIVQELNELKLLIERVRKEKQILFINLFNQSNLSDRGDITTQVKKIKNFIKSNNVLLLSYSELIDRIKKRDNVVLSTNRTKEENQFLVTVENRNQENIKDLMVEILLHNNHQTPEITNSNNLLTKSDKSNRYLITIPYLHAGMKEIFKLKFEKK